MKRKREGFTMINAIDFYYFSPTGGTKQVGEIFCEGICTHVKAIDLGCKDKQAGQPEGELAVIAAPVYGGRIPAMAVKKLEALEGNGKLAVTLAVYGTRAYEDALLELNQAAEKQGFRVAASAALVARHSIVPAVGAGRPDQVDREEILIFAGKVLDKIKDWEGGAVKVPGNYPYKKEMEVSATPISLPSCNQCGKCGSVCPTGAIQVEDGKVGTKLDSCMLCMACIYACPQHARMLPTPMQEALEQKLGELKSVRRENEYFL